MRALAGPIRLGFPSLVVDYGKGIRRCHYYADCSKGRGRILYEEGESDRRPVDPVGRFLELLQKIDCPETDARWGGGAEEAI